MTQSNSTQQTMEPVRQQTTPLPSPKTVASGKELVEFFRVSPLTGEDIIFERDRSSGRAVELDC